MYYIQAGIIYVRAADNISNMRISRNNGWHTFSEPMTTGNNTINEITYNYSYKFQLHEEVGDVITLFANGTGFTAFELTAGTTTITF